MKKTLTLFFLLILNINCISQNLNDELLPVRMDGNHFGYINRNGDVIIGGKFRRASSFSNGLAIVKINSKYSYINKRGEVVIQLSSKKPGSFNNGLANISLPSGKETYIDKTGKLLNHHFDIANKFKEGRALIYIQNQGYGFLNDKGDILVEPKFSDAESFYEGLAAVKINGKYGFINKKGEMIIAPKYDFVKNFNEGFAVVGIDKQVGFINTSGVLIIKPKFYRASNFKEGFALVQINGNYSLINKYGVELEVKTEFDELSSFSDGLARFKKNGKFGFIDKNGEVIIPPRLDFTLVENFSNGLARFKIETNIKGELPFREYGFIDKQGNIVIKPQFPSAGDFENELAYVRDKKTGYYLYINKDGKYIYYPKNKD